MILDIVQLLYTNERALSKNRVEVCKIWETKRVQGSGFRQTEMGEKMFLKKPIIKPGHANAA